MLIAPIVKYCCYKIPGFFESMFGPENVGKLSKILFPLSWLAQKGWLVIKKVGKFFYEMPLIQAIVHKVWSTTEWFLRFIYNNALLINLSFLCFQILKTFFCIYFMGPKLGIHSLKEWLKSQTVLLESNRWVQIFITIFENSLECLFTGGTIPILGRLWSCVKLVGNLLAGVLHLPLSMINSISGILHAIIPVSDVNHIFWNQENLREEALKIFNLDWDIVLSILPLLLPKIIRLFLGFLPIPPYLWRPIDKGLALISGGYQIMNAFGFLVRFSIDAVSTVWNCINFSGNCCFPRLWKEQNIRFEEISKLSTFAKISEAPKQLLSYLGQYLPSDERAKIRLGYSGVQIDGMNIYLYTLNPIYLRKFFSHYSTGSSTKKPKYLRRLYQSTNFCKKGQIFYSVSANEIEKQIPLAVKQICLRKKDCYRYIIFDHLPKKLQYALFSLNMDLLDNADSSDIRQTCDFLGIKQKIEIINPLNT